MPDSDIKGFPMLITSPIVVLYIGYPTQLTGTVTERSERASPASRSAADFKFQSSVRGNCQIRFGLTHIQIGRYRVYGEREKKESNACQQCFIAAMYCTVPWHFKLISSTFLLLPYCTKPLLYYLLLLFDNLILKTLLLYILHVSG